MSTTRINEELVKSNFEAPIPSSAQNYILVCGPPGFSNSAKSILSNLEYKYVTFLGMPNRYPEPPANWLGKIHRRSPHSVYWAVILILNVIVWSYSRGKIGFNGRFCVEGFKNKHNKIRYPYKIVNDANWAHGAKTESGICDFDQNMGVLISWLLFAPHLIANWWVIYLAQKENPKYQVEWRWFNWWTLYINAFFILAKIITNFYTYNGLATQLPLWFGEGTVLNILFIILAMYVPVRGMCCGRCSRGCTIGERNYC